MKRTSANLKTLARESLAGNFSLPVSAYLLITILTSVLSMIVTGFLDVSNTVSLITSQILIYLFSLLSSLLMAGYDKMISKPEPETALYSWKYFLCLFPQSGPFYCGKFPSASCWNSGITSF